MTIRFTHQVLYEGVDLGVFDHPERYKKCGKMIFRREVWHFWQLADEIWEK